MYGQTKISINYYVKKNIKFELLQDYISNKIKLENFMNQYNLKDKINKII